MKNNIYNHIKNTKEELDLDTPTPEMWNNIEKALDKKKNKRGFFYLRYAAGIALVLTAGFTFWMSNGSKESKEQVAKYDSEKAIPIASMTPEEYNYDNSYAYSNNESSYNENTKHVNTKKEFNTAEIINSESTENVISVNTYDMSGTNGLSSNISSEPLLNNADTYAWTDGNGTDLVGNSAGTYDVKLPAGKTYKIETESFQYFPDNNGNNLNQLQSQFQEGRTRNSIIYRDQDGYFDIDIKEIPPETTNRETYEHVEENEFIATQTEAISTFSIDVDVASYSNIRRMILNGQKPPSDAVRIEEMINYFDYHYKNPEGKHPFSIQTEVAQAPWKAEHQLLKIGIQGKRIANKNLPKNNLVFLLDVSGSMMDANKLGLLKI